MTGGFRHPGCHEKNGKRKSVVLEGEREGGEQESSPPSRWKQYNKYDNKYEGEVCRREEETTPDIFTEEIREEIDGDRIKIGIVRFNQSEFEGV